MDRILLEVSRSSDGKRLLTMVHGFDEERKRWISTDDMWVCFDGNDRVRLIAGHVEFCDKQKDTNRKESWSCPHVIVIINFLLSLLDILYMNTGKDYFDLSKTTNVVYLKRNDHVTCNRSAPLS